jgi:hypothetical protein
LHAVQACTLRHGASEKKCAHRAHRNGGKH